MNLGYLTPIIYQLYIWIMFPILFVYLFCWLFEKLAKKIFKTYYNIIYVACIILLGVFYCIYVPLIIVFWQNAGMVISADFWINILFLVIFLQVIYEGLKTLGKKLTILIYLTPFFISYLVFSIFYSGENIYKLSSNCEITNIPQIKKCTYINGYYLGELKAFKRHGFGKYYWNSGTTFEGNWKNNLKHGKGTTTVNGKEFVDNWIKGIKNK